MNDLKINIAKKEPQGKRNRKGLKGFAKFAKKNCFRTGVKGHKAERQLPFHYDPNINVVDVLCALVLSEFCNNEIEN